MPKIVFVVLAIFLSATTSIVTSFLFFYFYTPAKYSQAQVVNSANDISVLEVSTALANEDTALQQITNEDFKGLLLSPSPSSTPEPTILPTLKPTVMPTMKASKKPVSFTTLSVSASLPTGDECSKRVVRNKWEPRPDNAKVNSMIGRTGVKVDGPSDSWNARFAGRIDGNFTGTTDEILQWGACKWGFDVDTVRAVAVQESWWRHSTVGDNGESHGLLQVRNTYHKAAFPMAKESAAYNVDYALAWRRACYEGDFSWMTQKNSTYKAGDEWGCVGAWFSGSWYDGDANTYWSGANWYIKEVKMHRSNKTWLSKDF